MRLGLALWRRAIGVTSMAEAAPKLTLAHQALAACLAVIVAEVLESTRRRDALEMLAEITPVAHEGTPLAEVLVAAARELIRAAPDRHVSRGGMGWAKAMLTAHAAVADYNWARAAIAHDSLFPQPPEEAAHA